MSGDVPACWQLQAGCRVPRARCFRSRVMLRQSARKNTSPIEPATGTALVNASSPILPIMRSTVPVEAPNRRDARSGRPSAVDTTGPRPGSRLRSASVPKRSGTGDTPAAVEEVGRGLRVSVFLWLPCDAACRLAGALGCWAAWMSFAALKRRGKGVAGRSWRRPATRAEPRPRPTRRHGCRALGGWRCGFPEVFPSVEGGNGQQHGD